MQKSLIFTEGFGCGKILRNALITFHKFHDLKVFVFGTEEDFRELEPHPNNIYIDCTNHAFLKKSYALGHAGTAFIFAKVYAGTLSDLRQHIKPGHEELMQLKQVIHFDSDVIFKKESVSLLESAMDEGFDIVGSRRCYVNNPANIPVDPSIPDAMSTYFFGMKIDKIPKYDVQLFMRMCQGVHNPLGHEAFDFFDPVTFVALKNGARIKFIDQRLIGGQNERGSKHGDFKSNMHLDMGEHLAHFGGVGSGYAYHRNKQQQNESYGNWALGRWALYAKMFFNDDSVKAGPPVIAADGRWVHGGYDQALYELIDTEIKAA